MFTKSLIATAAVAAALTAAAPVEQAQAKTNIDIDVYFGGGYGWYPGYYPGYYPNKIWGVSCWGGRQVVKSHGFYNIHAFDCSKPVYQYKAWKFGQPYRVKVNHAGYIISVKHL
jgi:hypothetical protein